MADPDVFERRFRAALVGHVADGPTDFDALQFAHAVAAREPRRHGLRVVLDWRRDAVPSVAWVLLAVALLTALVAGILVAGSQLQRPLRAMVPPVGTALTCPAGSTPDAPGPVDQARPPQQDRSGMAFDRQAGRLVVLAGSLTGIETWTFDVCTNTWAQMHPDREPAVGSYGRLVYDIDSDATILVGYGAEAVWAYDLEANTWTEKGAAPPDAIPWTYDPLTGLVIVSADGQLWSYDVETDTWTVIGQTNGDGCGPCVYDASVDRIIGFGTQTGLFDIRTGTWSTSAADTPQVIAGYGWQAPEIAYDEAAERTVVFGSARIALFDATADRWETLDREQLGRPDSLPVSMVYDPVNGRLVGERWPALSDGRADVVAFDLGTREWTVLLAGAME